MRSLGSIAWYSVTGTVDRSNGRRRVIPVRVNHDQLEAWFAEFGLDSTYVPSGVKRVDAWRTATGSRVRHTYKADGRTVDLWLEEVQITDDFVVRNMMRNVRGDGQTAHVATLKFIRGGRTSRGKRHSGDHWKPAILTRVTGEERAEVQQFLDQIDEHYKDLSANLHETKLRGILRDYLTKQLQALPLRAGGGVYFVHTDHQDELERLQQVFRRAGGTQCRLEQHPLVDSPAAREMVSAALEEKVEDEARLLLADVEEALMSADRKRQRVPFQKFTELRARYEEDIASRCERYIDLGLPQQRAAVAAEMALEAINALKEHINITTEGGS